MTVVDVLREEGAEDSREGLRGEVRRGLLKDEGMKALPSWLFYDDEGSDLFSRITELEEYYLTKCEFEVLKRHGVDIARALVGVPFDVEPVNVIELGAGDGRKTKVLLDVLLRLEVPFEYFAVDISRKAVDFITERMALVFGNRVSVHGVVADNHEGLNFVRRRKPGRKNVVLFLGSSIGNYDMRGAETFLTGIRESLNPGDRLFVGFDLKKDPEIMRRAYSDAKGVTAAFNFNLLTRINHELTADFQPECFYHVANYNVHLGAMESWLLSAKDQDVTIPGVGIVHFTEMEPIHTEYSFKYTETSIRSLAQSAGFKMVRSFTDSRRWFLDAVFIIP